MITEETFVCKHCNNTLPISMRHPERPEYCALDYVSEADMKELEAICAEAAEQFGYAAQGKGK